jgi:hypothetical protein
MFSSRSFSSPCLPSSISVPAAHQRVSPPGRQTAGCSESKTNGTGRPSDALALHFPMFAKVGLHHLITCETRVIEYCPIHIDNTLIRPQDDYRLRYRLGDLAQLTSRLPNLLECLLQRGLRAIAFDGDSGNSAGVIDQPHFWADCTKIHSGRRS